MVASSAGLGLLHPSLEDGLAVGLVAGVHRLELAAVDSDRAVGAQVDLAAQQDEPAVVCLKG